MISKDKFKDMISQMEQSTIKENKLVSQLFKNKILSCSIQCFVSF